MQDRISRHETEVEMYHLAQKYRLSKTKLLFIVVISYKKLYISAQLFS